MQESLITKKIIAYSLMKLMEEVPFQKISIRQIMESAEIRRQTFYDHFQDKNELLGWMLNQAIQENMSDFLGYEEWSKVTLRVLEYFCKHRKFYRSVLDTPEHYLFNEHLLSHTKKLILTVIEEHSEKQTFYVQMDKKDLLATFYSQAVVGLTVEWLRCTKPVPAKDLSKEITGVVQQLVAVMVQQM